MIAKQRQPLRCRPVDQGLAGFQGHVCIRVETEMPIGMLEEDDVAGDRIARDHQPLMSRAVTAGKLKRDMAGRVSPRVEHLHAADDFVAGFDQSQSVLDREEIALRALGKAMEHLRHRLFEVGIGPELPFALRDEILRIRKGELAIGANGTARMIGMGVGQHHLRHSARVDAGCEQVGVKLAGTFLKPSARAVVDHDQIVAAANDRNVGVKRRAFRRAAKTAHDLRPLFRRCIRQNDADRQHDETITDNRDIEAAMPETSDV